MNEQKPSPLQRVADAYVTAVARFAAHPGDSPELQVEKGLLVGGTFFVLPATILWGVAYLLYGELLAAAIAFAYLLISVGGLLHLRFTGQRRPLALTQLICTLLLPFALTLVLGGFANSSAIILAAIMAPLGTLLYYPETRPERWFAAYLLLIFLAGFLDPFVRRENGLPPWLIVTFFVLNVAVLSSVVYLMIRAYIQQRNAATVLLRREQDKSERLLLNVLPASVAAVLKEEYRTIAERFDNVSILFADVVGSTPLSERLDPAELVDMLNEVFNHFDSIVEKYELEKIRTMGDNYMVVAGAPVPREDHASVLAQAALEMMDYPMQAASPRVRKLQFRMGMNCGPVVAGVIGHTKFHYDVWGDPVNVASRMESHGVPGRIQVSRRVAEILQEQYVCVPRGRIQIKGKGLMETWFLTGRKELAGEEAATPA